ncbi:MAG: hypothetical protein U0264_08935 [Candidatus Kapaibacterium sp.]
MIKIETIKDSLVDLVIKGHSESLSIYCRILEVTNLNELAAYKNQNPDNGSIGVGYLNHAFYLNKEEELMGITSHFPKDSVEVNSLYTEVSTKDDLKFSTFNLYIREFGIR